MGQITYRTAGVIEEFKSLNIEVEDRGDLVRGDLPETRSPFLTSNIWRK